MDDDFDTPEADRRALPAGERGVPGHAAAARQLKALGAVLGLLQRDPQAFCTLRRLAKSDAWIDERIAARQAARKNKNFGEADRIRQELPDKGIVLEDKAGSDDLEKGVRSGHAGRPTQHADPSAGGADHALDQRACRPDDGDERLADLQRLAALRRSASRTASRSAAGSPARCSGTSRRCGCWSLNGLVYVAYGIVSGHFRRKLLPISPRAVLRDIAQRAARAGWRTTTSPSTTPRSARPISRSIFALLVLDPLRARDLEAGAVPGARAR